MPAQPNLEVLKAVQDTLPQTAAITHSNNTVMVAAPDTETKDKWVKLLESKRLVIVPHRVPTTIIVSMWPHRQIALTSRRKPLQLR